MDELVQVMEDCILGLGGTISTPRQHTGRRTQTVFIVGFWPHGTPFLPSPKVRELRLLCDIGVDDTNHDCST